MCLKRDTLFNMSCTIYNAFTIIRDRIKERTTPTIQQEAFFWEDQWRWPWSIGK